MPASHNMCSGIYTIRGGVVDFPSRWALTMYFAGCNLSCDFCHNPHVCESSVGDIDLREAKQRIDKLRSLHPSAGVVFSGGEPTINSDFLPLYRYCVKNQIPTSLHTNGVELVKEANTFDSVIIGVKPFHNYFELKIAVSHYLHTSKRLELRGVLTDCEEDNKAIKELFSQIKNWYGKTGFGIIYNLVDDSRRG